MLTRVADIRKRLDCVMALNGQPDARAQKLAAAAQDHLNAAREAALGEHYKRVLRRAHASIGGANVERALGNLDAAECDLLRLSGDRVFGQLPTVLARVRQHLDEKDPRRVAVERFALRPPGDGLEPTDRDQVLAALHAASSEARRKVLQVRSFRNTLLATAVALTIAAIAMAVVGWRLPDSIPLCFHPDDVVVCPTSETRVESQRPATTDDSAEMDAAMRKAARPGDVALIELLGVMAAALAAALALRNVKGTSTPYSLPIALAILKLPTGALTAVLAIVLMRGDFVPGLSALDSSAQILAWALIFGYAQQLFTQLVDRQAHTVLENVGSSGTTASGTTTSGSPAASPTGS